MSAKWRRGKRCSKWSNVLRAFNGVKRRNVPRTLRIGKSKVQKWAYPYRCRIRKIPIKTKWREPKPLADILEENDELVIVAEFAGFKRENLRIHVGSQRLTLSAETLDRKYYKSLNLPKRVIADTIRTTHRNGVLQIRFKKDVEKKAIHRVVG